MSLERFHRMVQRMDGLLDRLRTRRGLRRLSASTAAALVIAALTPLATAEPETDLADVAGLELAPEEPTVAQMRLLAEGWQAEPVDLEERDENPWPEGWEITWPDKWRVDNFHRSERSADLIVRDDRDHPHNRIGQISPHTWAHAYLTDTHMLDSAQQVDVQWFMNQGTNNRMGLIARYRAAEPDPDSHGTYTGPEALYEARLYNGDRSLRIERIVDGDRSTLAVARADPEADPHPDNDDAEAFQWERFIWNTLRFEVRQRGDQTELRAKMWPRGEPEPENWTVTVTDDAPELQHRAGLVGISSRTSGNRRWWLDNYRIGDDDTPRVEWRYDESTHPAGREDEDEDEDEAGEGEVDKDALVSDAFGVPRIGEVEIDASVDDWWDRGLPLKFLADSDHQVPDPDDLSAEARLGWNDDGLLVLVKVDDDRAAEYPDEADLWQGDGLELFVSDGVGSRNRYQVALSPGRDEAHPEPRHWFYDKDDGVERDALSLELATRPMRELRDEDDASDEDNGNDEDGDAGYVIEVLLPWSNLGEDFAPGVGGEFAFQMYVNDLDDVDEPDGWQWIGLHPARYAAGDPGATLPFELTDAEHHEPAGPALRARAEVEYDERTRQLHVQLVGDPGLADRAVSVHAPDYDPDDPVAEASFAIDDEHPNVARARVALPGPPYGQRWAKLEARIEDAQRLALHVPEDIGHEHAAHVLGTIRALEQSELQIDLKDRLGEQQSVSVPIEQLTENDQRFVASWHNRRARQSPPEWLEGYTLRYKLNVADNFFEDGYETVTVTLPTGGWLNEYGDDIAVVASDGTELPVVVLSHDPVGDTTIQFRRYQSDDVYWVYALNPDAEPGELLQFEEDPETLRLEAEEATLAMMAAQREAGELSGRERDLAAEVERERETRDEAAEELAEWQELLPEREAEKEEAAAALEEAEATHEEAAEAHEEPGRIADEKSEEARRLTRAARSARRAADEAEQGHAAAEEALTEARRAGERAERDHAEAEREHEQARDALEEAEADLAEARAALEDDDLEEGQREAAERRAQRAEQAVARARARVESAAESLEEARAEHEAAPERIAEAEQALEEAEAAKREKLAAAEEAEAEAEPAEEAAQQARLDAAPTASALEEAEEALSTARSRAERTENLVEEARERIEELEGIIADAEAALAELEPELEPVAEAAAEARQEAREAATRAEELEQRYYQLAYEADPRVFREGLTVEYRDWEGDRLGDWPVVVDGLEASETVTDNAIVSSVYQRERLFRNIDGRNFAASYRGFLEVDESGIYSFFVNTEDTVFLFINGYLAYSRTGTNERITGRVPTFAVGADMQLEAGVHTLEVHHVVGNTRGATGRGMMLWIPPEEESWSIVPESAFPRSALAVPVGLEAQDGEPVAFFDYGVEDKLSADGMALHLTRFQALGPSWENDADADRLEWSFDDGTTRAGRSVRHVFFEPGDTLVSLDSHPDIPPFQRRAHIRPEENEPSPFGLAQAVEAIGEMVLGELETTQLHDAYHFLRICAQENRWPVMERVARELLSRDGVDLKQQALLYGSLMRALAQQGHSSDATGLIDEALAAVEGVRTLEARVMLDAANVYRDVLRDFGEADALYERIVSRNRRLRHPIVREAAVAWGDLYLEAGDRAQAGEAFRMARRLGRVGAGATATDPVERGALLRVAEQQLQHDDVRQSRRMLERIEQNHPEEKLDGLYRFLRAEADRHAGDYRQAIRHYEAVMGFSEWSSYHPHALRGIADAHYRMGEFETALDWFAALQSRHPRVYDELELAGQVALIEDRLERLAEIDADDEADGDASAADRLFARLSHNFEPASNPPDPRQPRLTMGFNGPGTFMIRRGDGEVELEPFVLENLPTQGELRVEFWYRSRLGDTTSGAHERYSRVRVYDGEDERIGDEQFYFPRTFGRWRKVTFDFDAPRTRDGRVEISLRAGAELLEIDAVTIKHVSDGQANTMRRFLEGADPH